MKNINLDYYGRIDPRVEYFAMCCSTSVEQPYHLPHNVKDIVRCDYCKVKNSYEAPFCQACGAALP